LFADSPSFVFIDHVMLTRSSFSFFRYRFASGAEDGYVRLHTFDKDYYGMHSELDDLSAIQALVGSS